MTDLNDRSLSESLLHRKVRVILREGKKGGGAPNSQRIDDDHVV